MITVNCAVLGVAVLNSEAFLLTAGLCRGVLDEPGPGIFRRSGLSSGNALNVRDTGAPGIAGCPQVSAGVPLAFIVASLMSLAFMGFSGFKF